MAIRFDGENAVLSNPNFSRRDFDAAVRDNRYNHAGMPDRSTTGAKAYDLAIRRLQRMQGNLPPGELSPQSRATIRDLVTQVRDARLASARSGTANADTVAQTGAQTGPQTGTPQNRLIQNPGEQGVWRDPGTGQIVRRDNNAQTALEQLDNNERYARSDRTQYRSGPTFDQVMAGSRQFREGDKGPGVKQLQEMLRAAGYNVGRKGADGFYGPDTARAVQEFMRHNNNANGMVGNAEIERLRHTRLENI